MGRNERIPGAQFQGELGKWVAGAFSAIPHCATSKSARLANDERETFCRRPNIENMLPDYQQLVQNYH